jgi:N-acylneuraminate cytidylyltransferase/CMP-N,N'-diacetyllegionaminic acid synthase
MKTEEKKLVAIIPARGGSKGLPGKNIINFAGKPLIAHTIIAAQKAACIGRVIVSTEDTAIKQTALSFGAEVIDRPTSLAQDNTRIEDVITQVLKIIKSEKYQAKYFVLLQPTSPLRGAEHIDNAAKLFFTTKRALSLMSVTEPEHHPYKFLKVENQILKPFFNADSLSRPRQMLPIFYRQNGAIYIEKIHLFLEYNTFFIPPCVPFLMSHDESVDIDTYFDLMKCEHIIKNRGET